MLPPLTDPPTEEEGAEQLMMLEARPFRPFKSSEEYLYAMKEDLAEWLNTLYQIDMDVDNFFVKLEDGVLLCRVSRLLYTVCLWLCL